MSVYARRLIHSPTATCEQCGLIAHEERPRKTRRLARRHTRLTRHTVFVDENKAWAYEWVQD